MTNERFAKLFGQPVRGPDEELTSFHMDVAASIQAVTDDVVLKLTRTLVREHGIRNLCLAGGVALNCVANGKMFAMELSIGFGFSRPQATPAARSVPLWPAGISNSASRATSMEPTA